MQIVTLLIAIILTYTLPGRVSAGRRLSESSAQQQQQQEVLEVAGINPSSITSQSQLSQVPSEYWDHVLNDLPKELPFAKLWTGGWCPLAYGNPAPLGPDTARYACIKCVEGCAVCPRFSTHAESAPLAMNEDPMEAARNCCIEKG